jgi:hypothetical protein
MLVENILIKIDKEIENYPDQTIKPSKKLVEGLVKISSDLCVVGIDHYCECFDIWIRLGRYYEAIISKFSKEEYLVSTIDRRFDPSKLNSISGYYSEEELVNKIKELCV